MSAWLQYQSLWDMPVSTVRTRLGSDVSLWCQMLTEAKAARAVVENSSREKAFGPVIVDYSSVQAKVSVREGLVLASVGGFLWSSVLVFALLSEKPVRGPQHGWCW